MAAARFASIDQLGKGAWKVSSSTPFAVPGKPGYRERRPGARDDAVLHDLLWEAMRREFGGSHKLVREFAGIVAGRNFRVDIAIPEARIAVEVDGWQWHAKHRADFVRDRDRQNLITAQCWQFLRFTAGMIRKDLPGCLDLVRKTLANRPAPAIPSQPNHQ